MGKEANARIVLPESTDKRIQEASTELTTMGFEILYNQDFQDEMDIFLSYIHYNYNSNFICRIQII